jgi:glycosyltransferase involved in cell wall biosynthesis
LKKFAISDERIKYFCQTNKGAGPTRNHGLREAKGQYIAFLDADDYWDKEFIETLLKQLLSTGADLAYCGWQNVGLSSKQGAPYIPPDYSLGDKVSEFLSACPWPIHAALTKKTVIDSVGQFDENLSSCMDYDLWLKIGTRFDITLTPTVMSYYRHHDNEQITKNTVRIAKNHLTVQNNYLKNNPDLVKNLGKRKLRELTLGELLNRAYTAYWQRDLRSARQLFRLIMKHRYGGAKDWQYMLPSLLPYWLHLKLLAARDERS